MDLSAHIQPGLCWFPVGTGVDVGVSDSALSTLFVLAAKVATCVDSVRRALWSSAPEETPWIKVEDSASPLAFYDNSVLQDMLVPLSEDTVTPRMK